MNKSDLNDGMMLKLRDDNIYSLLHGYLLELSLNDIYNIIASIDEYDDEFNNLATILSKPSVMDIMNIYDKDMNVLWERKVVDWSEVPLGAKVLASDNKIDWYERLFIKCSDYDNEYKFKCIDSKNKIIRNWVYCKLAEDTKEEITYNELNKEVDKICKKYYKENKSCKNCIAFNLNGLCDKGIIADEIFTITRK
ncbi:hypothetical protein [Terrisporobacter sp.]|uniref:hypothetical protein n=1 Tax=Terrisporobacter sp. TaxID=1965305 RepID=UPI00289A8883|nr:hypothetical protein [Terrisporobacter sp.]